MVNFNNVVIERAIMHKITERHEEVPASVTPMSHLLSLDEDSHVVIKKRLIAAFGRQSKSFELEIEKDGPNTCFDYVKQLYKSNDDQFIGFSTEIAQLLADSQRLSSIPGGFLLVIQCLFEGKTIIVLIKAEPHDALGVTEMSVQTIKDIILSPEQKLYKAVYYEPKEQFDLQHEPGRDEFSVVVFDSIVGSNYSIAQYFYKNFLGLTISKNAELQTAKFYTRMEKKITGTLSGMSAINSLDLLRAEVANTASLTINPHDLILSIIPPENVDDFLASIVDDFPQAFAKNTGLLVSKFQNKSILLSNNNVKITAPASFFDQSVRIEECAEEGSYIIRIPID